MKRRDLSWGQLLANRNLVHVQVRRQIANWWKKDLKSASEGESVVGNMPSGLMLLAFLQHVDKKS